MVTLELKNVNSRIQKITFIKGIHLFNASAACGQET